MTLSLRNINLQILLLKIYSIFHIIQDCEAQILIWVWNLGKQVNLTVQCTFSPWAGDGWGKGAHPPAGDGEPEARTQGVQNSFRSLWFHLVNYFSLIHFQGLKLSCTFKRSLWFLCTHQCRSNALQWIWKQMHSCVQAGSKCILFLQLTIFAPVSHILNIQMVSEQVTRSRGLSYNWCGYLKDRPPAKYWKALKEAYLLYLSYVLLSW